MQTVNKLLLLALAAAGLVYWWTQHQSTVEYDRQVGALASTLDRRLHRKETPAPLAEAQYLRALVIFSDYRLLRDSARIRTPEDIYLIDALTAAGYTTEREISLIAKSLVTNLNLCQELQILPAPEGTAALLTAQPPLIPTGPFRGETLLLARSLHPVLVPDLVNHPANYTLIPASAAALTWPFTLTDYTLRTIQEFKSQGLLDPKLALDLKQRADQLKTKRSPPKM